MPSVSEAFSTERGEILGAGQAWALSLLPQGLADARAFHCPGSECQAQATLVNFGRPREEISITPHFRVNEPHGIFCPYADEDGATCRPIDDFHKSVDEDRPDTSELPDYARLGDRKQGQTSYPPPNPGSRSDEPSERLYAMRHTTMGGIVAHYAALRRTDAPHERQLRLNGVDKSYRDWFIAVFRGFGRLRRQGVEPAIYWGKAWMDRTKRDDGFLLSVITGPKGDQLFTFKLFIKDSDFHRDERGQRQLERMRLIQDSGKPGYVFAYTAIDDRGEDGKTAFVRILNPQVIEIQRMDMWRSLNSPEEENQT